MGEGALTLRIGIQTAFSAPAAVVPFEFAAEHGFDAFEWFPDKKASGAGWSTDEVSAATRSWIHRVAARNGLQLSVHASLASTPVTAAGATQLAGDLEFARDIGARLVNVHLDPTFGIESFVQAIGSTARRAQAMGIALAVENTPLTTPTNLNELCFRLGREGTVPPVGICLDVGHANLCAATPNDYLGFVDRLVPQVPIIHLHLHENRGDQDSHLTLFTGPAAENPAGVVGLLDRLSQRGFCGNAILEQWPEPPELLLRARDRLLELVGGPPWRPARNWRDGAE